MANLNDAQEALISRLEHVRADYEKFEAELMKEVSDRKWEAKAAMRELVREARNNGVPYRRIGFALKTSDHNTLRDYESDTRKDAR